MTESARRVETGLACPSASADDEHARVIGVIGGSLDEPRVDYLDNATRVTPELRALLAEGVTPGEVFRLAAGCHGRSCREFANGRCSVGNRVSALQAVAVALPDCAIRSSCRWHMEHGDSICLRCPQVVTLTLGSKRRLPLL